MGCRQKNRQVCQNFILLLHKNILRKKITKFFLEFERFFFQILTENLGQVCRNYIVRGETSHSGKTNGFRKANSWSFVFGFLVESFWFSAKKYRHVCQNCILSLTGRNWGRMFEQFCQCLFFSDFRRQLFEIVANYSGKTLSELPCKCPEESFGKKLKKLFSLCFWMVS